jgi:hypothetical protein
MGKFGELAYTFLMRFISRKPLLDTLTDFGIFSHAPRRMAVSSPNNANTLNVL